MIEIKSDMVKEFIYKKDYNYVIYVKETITSYECYLQNENYGIITLLFGVNKRETTMQDFIETILGCIDSHIEDYKKSYEDSDLLF